MNPFVNELFTSSYLKSAAALGECDPVARRLLNLARRAGERRLWGLEWSLAALGFVHPRDPLGGSMFSAVGRPPQGYIRGAVATLGACPDHLSVVGPALPRFARSAREPRAVLAAYAAGYAVKAFVCPSACKGFAGRLEEAVDEAARRDRRGVTSWPW